MLPAEKNDRHLGNKRMCQKENSTCNTFPQEKNLGNNLKSTDKNSGKSSEDNWKLKIGSNINRVWELPKPFLFSRPFCPSQWVPPLPRAFTHPRLFLGHPKSKGTRQISLTFLRQFFLGGGKVTFLPPAFVHIFLKGGRAHCIEYVLQLREHCFCEFPVTLFQESWHSRAFFKKKRRLPQAKEPKIVFQKMRKVMNNPFEYDDAMIGTFSFFFSRFALRVRFESAGIFSRFLFSFWGKWPADMRCEKVREMEKISEVNLRSHPRKKSMGIKDIRRHFLSI